MRLVNRSFSTGSATQTEASVIVQDRPKEPILVADIGGTNTRIARLFLSDGGHVELSDSKQYANADYVDWQDLFREYLQFLVLNRQEPRFSAVHFAIAGPVEVGGTVVSMTNLPWQFTKLACVKLFGTDMVHFCNDFEAQALATYVLESLRLSSSMVAPSESVNAKRLILGPGTGLGVAVTFGTHQGLTILATEYAHQKAAPFDAVTASVIQQFAVIFGDTPTYEQLLSGTGLPMLYAALQKTDSTKLSSTGVLNSTAEIVEQAKAGSPVAVQAVGLFLRWLGVMSAELCHTFQINDGVYWAGGVLPKIRESISIQPLLDAFSDHRQSRGRAALTHHLVTHEYPALIGLGLL